MLTKNTQKPILLSSCEKGIFGLKVYGYFLNGYASSLI